MSEEQKYGKPLKLGFLFILAPGKLKRVFKYRFCILTTFKELDWYKKQEDCQEHKRGGAINVDGCEIEEIEDLQGQPFCFQVKLGSKTSVLAAESHQDRLNWMVEILKFRGIPGLIKLLESVDLSKHAAYALANLAGRKSDDSQLEIVKCGAIAPLLSFQKKCEDETLVETIYYAFSKLSTRDENRLEIGSHLPELFLLLEGPHERWKEFVLSTAVNCASHPQIRSVIRENDDIARILGTLCAKSTGEKLQQLCLEALIVCSDEPETKQLIITSHLQLLAEIIHNLPIASQVETVRLIACCAEDKELGIPTMAEIRIVRSLMPLLDSDSTTLLAALLGLFETLITYEEHREGVRACYALPHIVSAITFCDQQPVSSETVVVIEAAVHIIGQVWEKEEDVCTLAESAQLLLPIIQLLSHDNKTIHQSSLRVLHQVCLPDKSRLELGDHEDVVHALLHGLLHLISSKGYDQDTLTLALSTLSDVAEVDAVKVDMCREQVLEKLVAFVLGETRQGQVSPSSSPSDAVPASDHRESPSSSLSFPPEMIEKLLSVICKCSEGRMGKIMLASSPHMLGGLISFIASPKDRIQVNALRIARNCAVIEQGFRFLLDQQVVENVTPLLNPTETSEDTAVAALELFANLMYYQSFCSTQHAKGLPARIIPLLESKHSSVRAAAARALRNSPSCCDLGEPVPESTWRALFSMFQRPTDGASPQCDVASAVEEEGREEADRGNTPKGVDACSEMARALAGREVDDEWEQSVLDVCLFCRAVLVHSKDCSVCTPQKSAPSVIGFRSEEGVRNFLALLASSESHLLLGIAASALAMSVCNDETCKALGSLGTEHEVLFEKLSHKNNRVRELLLQVIANGCSMSAELLSNFLSKAHLDRVAIFIGSKDIECARLAADILFRCSYLATGRKALEGHLSDVARTLIETNDKKLKHSLAGIILNCTLNDNDSVLSSNHMSLLHFLMTSRAHDVKAVDNCEWKLDMESNGDEHIVRVTGKPQPALTFSFPNADMLNVHTAIAIACAHFNIPVETSVKQFVPASNDAVGEEAKSASDVEEVKTDDGAVVVEKESESQSVVSGFQAASTPLKERTTKGVRMGGNRQLPPPQQVFVDPPTKQAPPPPDERAQQYDRRTLEILRRRLGEIAEYLLAARVYDVVMSPSHALVLDSMENMILESYPKKRSALDCSLPRPRTLRTDSPLIEISEDGYRAKYIGEGDDYSVGAVKGSRNNVSRSSFSYFEVAVVNSGVSGYIGIGLTIATYPDNQQPGWSKGSWAYHGDDGNRFWVIVTENDEFHNDAYGPRYQTGDIIGCGYNNINGDIFFTKNGEYLGVAFQDVPRNLCPCVGLGSRGEEVYVNFGQKPFLWKVNTNAPTVPIKPAPKATDQPGEGPGTVSQRDPGPFLHVFECMQSEWTFMAEVE